MAEKILNTRIALKYDAYETWMSSSFILKKGELAITTIESKVKDDKGNIVNVPNVMIKVGDGKQRYSALPFVSGLAADVYSWAKEANLPVETSGEGVVSNVEFKTTELHPHGAVVITKTEAEAKGAAAQALIDAKAYTDAEIGDLGDQATVKAYVDKKTEDIASNEALTTLAGRVTTAENEITTLIGGEEVEGSVAEAKKAGIDAAAAVDEKLTAEVTRAKKAEKGIDTNATAIAKLNGKAEVEGSVAHAVAAEAKIARAAEEANAAAIEKEKGALAKATANESAIDTHKKEFETFKGTNTKAIEDAKKAGTDANAALETYKTSNDEAVKAIADDYLTSVDKAALTMSMTTKEHGEADVYTFQQGSSPAFTINIPKEMVVESGTVKEVAEINVPYEGAQVGDKYIDLVLNNKKHIYVPAKDLVDVYTGIEGTNINITVDQSKNEISAVLNENSVTNTQLAGNIAEEKLDKSLKTKLGKIATNEIAISNIETKLGNGTLVADKANKATGDEDGLNIKENYALKSELHSHANKEELDLIESGDVALWNAEKGANAAIKALSEGAVATNTNAIAAINNEENGILAQAKADTTQKIADLKLKDASQHLASDFATSAQGAKADSALQKSDIIEGTTQGAITVKGEAVNVHGLGSAAYTSADTYATAAQGEKADSALQKITANRMIKQDGQPSGLKVSENNNVEIDTDLTFVFDCGSATENI